VLVLTLKDMGYSPFNLVANTPSADPGQGPHELLQRPCHTINRINH